MKSFSTYVYLLIMIFGIIQQNYVEAKPSNATANKEWRYISSDNFDAYYYEENALLAQMALVIAEQELKNLEAIIDYRLGNRTQIIVFQNDFDLSSSNLKQPLKPYNQGVYSYVVESKIVVAFNGNRKDFRVEIRKGAAEILVNELMHGGSISDRLRTNNLLYMPEWFYGGLISYLSEPWNPVIDNSVRDAMERGLLKKIALLSGKEAHLAGHSWWNYIAEVFGQRRISDILYLTRVSRGYENALSFVLGIHYRNIFKDWENYYTQRYTADPGVMLSRTAIKLNKSLSKREMGQIRLAPDAKKVLFSCQFNGNSELWLYDVSSQKAERIYNRRRSIQPKHKHEALNVAWHPDGRTIHLFGNDDEGVFYEVINLFGKRISQQRIQELGSVLSFAFHADGKAMVLSATHNGQSDIYLYQGNELQALTLDGWDDFDPVFSENGETIYFVSNRGNNGVDEGQQAYYPNDSSDLDLYAMPFPNQSNTILRKTNTPFINETQPNPFLNDGVSYLSDNNGIINLYIALPANQEEEESSFRHYPLSNYNRNVLQHHNNQRLTHEATLISYLGDFYLEVYPISEAIENDAKLIEVIPTVFRKKTGWQAFINQENRQGYLIKRELQYTDDAVEKPDSIEVERKGRYHFQTGFPDEKPRQPSFRTIKKKEITYVTDPKSYKTVFFPVFMASQLIDNSILNTPYYINDEASRSFNTFARPNINSRVEFGIQDLHNNNQLVIGGRLPFGLNGTDFYLRYRNSQHRLNYGVQVFRNSRLIDINRDGQRVSVQEIRPYASYQLPFSMVLQLAPFYRLDRSVRSATDVASLGVPNNEYHWVGAKIELSLDRQLSEEINFPVGLKARLNYEHYQNINGRGKGPGILGFDIRWNKKLHKKVLWANRVSGAMSRGDLLVNYMLGGIDNWLGNQYNEALGTSQQHSYIFNAMSSGVRGFPQNVRNGGNHLIINSEIRIPIMSYLLPNPTSSNLLKTLQWVGFFDMGSAWNGINPYEKQHYNTRYINQGSLAITVTNQNNPFVYGFGTGLRTRISSYYLKVDMAWGIENGQIANEQKAIWHISLGQEF